MPYTKAQVRVKKISDEFDLRKAKFEIKNS